MANVTKKLIVSWSTSVTTVNEVWKCSFSFYGCTATKAYQKMSIAYLQTVFLLGLSERKNTNQCLGGLRMGERGVLITQTFQRNIFFSLFTVPFNNKRTLKFKAQPTNTSIKCLAATQLPTTAEHCFV